MLIPKIPFGASILLLVGFALLGACADSDDASTSRSAVDVARMEVFKNPSCGCCGKWVKHIESMGFKVTTGNSDRLAAIKQEYGISPQLQSCHTAISDGYVFEGHIPASLIKKFLREKPPGAIGLSVPGMPAGSPGMEVSGRPDPYDVLLLHDDGSTSIYTHIDGSKK